MRTAQLGALVFTAFALVACGSQRTAAVAPRTAPPAGQAAALPALEPVNAVARHVGDFNVHVVSGSFRKRPALLTERVVAREDETWVIEYKLEDDEGARSLRIWSDPNGDVTRVAVLVDGEEQPGTLTDYETFMASASLAPDENVGLTASTKGTCMVGPSELDCETKNYRVMLGEQEANLGITESHAVPGVDLAGEITAPDGTVIYRAVLVEHGNAANAGDASFALGEP
ncbi:MAG TPA: hypothetical protein VLJ38_22735 [Polyangiaceae bacterium]|nr:hypothetical protein [Polyangiaceae bacterium]